MWILVPSVTGRWPALRRPPGPPPPKSPPPPPPPPPPPLPRGIVPFSFLSSAAKDAHRKVAI